MASIYSPTDYNPKILKSEGSTAANQRGVNTYRLIDPNPDMEVVPLEDLFIFVDLKARSRPKSLIQTTTDEKTYSLTVLQGTVVSVGAGDQSLTDKSKISSKQLFNGLTTDWTEIGGIGSIKAVNQGDYDPQGFAMTNIDISIKSQDAPKVVIDFVDVRGATLFEQGSCSPYGFFFQLPYPVFELTVKGYYGKAVTYYLNLVSFNTKFNAESGNFECRAEFVGYSFAFLSDILMGYVMAASYLDNKKYKYKDKLRKIYEDTIKFYNETEKQKNPNAKPLTINTFCPGGTCLTIFQVIKALREFELKGGAGLKDNTDYKKVQNLGDILNVYNSYRQTVEDLIVSLNSYTKIQTNAAGINGKRPIKISFGAGNLGKTEVEKLLNPTNGVLYNFFNRIGGQAALKIKEIIAKVSATDSGVDSGKITCLSAKPDSFKGNTPPYSLFDSPNLVNKPWFGGGGNSTNSLSSLGYVSPDVSSDGYYIDFGFILNDIDAEIKYLAEKIDIESDNYADAIEEKIISVLKFSPTINSVFTILMANAQAFMEVLKEVSIKAEKYHSTEDLKNYTINGGTSYVENTDIVSNSTNTKTVYSWPTYSTVEGGVIGLGEVEKYPGTNSNFKDWPEVDFVQDFLVAFLAYQKSVEELFAPEVPYTSQPGQDNFAPINPLETRAWIPSGNGYFGKNSQPDILKTIGERLFISLDHTIFNPIRFTRDAIKMRDPKESFDIINKYLSTAAKLDANNLLNATKNTTNLNGWIPGDEAAFIDGVKKALGTDLNEVRADQITKIRVVDPDSPSSIKIDGITTSTGTNIRFLNIPLEEPYYVYNPSAGIVLKKDDKGNGVTINPDPFMMNKDYLVKLIKPEEVKNLQPISLSSEKFKSYIENDYKNEIITATKSFGYENVNFSNLGLTDLVSINNTQQSLSFNKPILFTTLGMSAPIEEGEGPNGLQLGGPASGSGGFGGITNAAGDLGPMVSNMGMISYWTRESYEVVGVDLLYKNFRINNKIDEDIYTPDVEDLTSVKIFKENNFYSPLVTTPMWLDNVIKFREKIDSAKAKVNYDPDTDQLKNLAYLFLHSLKPTPLFVRLISGQGVFARSGTDFFDLNDDNLTSWGFNHINDTTVSKIDDGIKSSIPWAITAFNNIGAISEVPKAWVLAFGSQLWRWRQFIGNKTGDVWKKTIICQLCNGGTENKPNGNDPLIQPGYNSIYSGERSDSSISSVYNKKRNNISFYLEKIYDVKHKTNVNTKIPLSVFHPDASNSAKNLYTTSKKGDSYGGFPLWNTVRKSGAFFYYALRENEMGKKLGKVNGLLKDVPFINVTDQGYYSWPQTYIAPHHIPYISPDLTGIFAVDGDFKKHVTGKGSDFVFLFDSYNSYQDYTTIQPVRVYRTQVNKRISLSKNTNKYGFCNLPYLEIDVEDKSDGTIRGGFNNTSRSKEEDANLGMIFQYLPDAIKDLFAEEFETWATSQEWKEMLKTIDPVHFGDPSKDTLIGPGRYSYKKGTGSPSAINYENADERVNISLDSDATKISNLLNENYWVLNSTPKIWYGYQGSGSLGSTKNDPNFSNQFDDNNEKQKGFYSRKTDFDSYLKVFYTEYKAKLPDRIKEITDAEAGSGDGGKKTTVDPLKDDDLKLSLYRTFKSLSEKWLQRTPDGEELFFNIGGASSIYCKKNEKTKTYRTLPSYFVYVNRVWGDIGNKSILDIARLSEIKDNNKISLYQIITDILSENEYLFFALPSYINFTGTNGMLENDLKDMFRPVLNLDDAGCGPLFVCMYVGGASRKLNLQIGQQNCKIDNEQLSSILNNVRDDGFSLEDIQQPIDISTGNFTAFKVLYGKQNQNHFKNIQLDQSDFTETAESLAVLDRLSANQGTDTTSKGQNLTSAYLTRSYKCSVETMGNMMIQPMLYFDLQGIPMFSGSYIITEVNHNIKPNNATTTFKGLRQPRTVVPIVNSVAVAMKLVPQRRPVINSGSAYVGGESYVSAGSSGIEYGKNKITVKEQTGPNHYTVKVYWTIDPRKLNFELNDLPSDVGERVTPGLSKLRNVIGTKESKNCYNSYNWYKKGINPKTGVLGYVFGGGSFCDTNALKLSPILQEQKLKDIITNMDNGDPTRLFASGRYQIIPSTLKGSKGSTKIGGLLANSTVISSAKKFPGEITVVGNEISLENKFSPLLQECLFAGLIDGSEFKNYFKGTGTENQLQQVIDAISEIWAAYPRYHELHLTALIEGSRYQSESRKVPIGYLSGTGSYGAEPPNDFESSLSAYNMAKLLIQAWGDYNPGKTPEFKLADLESRLDQELAAIPSLTQNISTTVASSATVGDTAESICGGSKAKINFTEKSTNIFMGDSLVGTMNAIISKKYKDKIAIGPNCGGTRLDYIDRALKTDERYKDKVFTNVKQVFISNGANYGYQNTTGALSQTKTLSVTLKTMFPNAKVYIVPGGGCWAVSPYCKYGGRNVDSCKKILNLTYPDPSKLPKSQPDFYLETFVTGSNNTWKVIKPACWDSDCSCVTQGNAHNAEMQIYKDDVEAMVNIIDGKAVNFIF